MAEGILIKNGFVLTMDETNQIIADGAVVIRGDRIVAVGPTAVIEPAHQCDTIIDAHRHVVMPGLVNLHYHSSLGRGMYDDLPLSELAEVFWYPKMQAMTPEEAYWGALCGYIDSIKRGTTTVNDQWRQMEACADAAEKAGIRAVLSGLVGDDPALFDTLADNERLYQRKHGAANGRIRVFFGLDLVPLAAEELLMQTRQMADRYQTGIQIHLNESREEVDMSLQRHGKRPTAVAYATGLLGPDCIANHCVWLAEEEATYIAQTGTHISHNPVANAKSGVGIAPVPDYLARGINVGIGHDSAVANNSVDMFEQMKWAALLHRAARADSLVMPTDTVLRMATVNGSIALQQETGVLAPGKLADVILINLHAPHFAPLVTGADNNLKPHLVYSAHGDDVVTTIIAGQIVMLNRVIQTVDEQEVVERATRAFLEMFKRIKR